MEQQHQRTSEEIDLLYFFSPLVKGAKKAGSSTVTYMRRLQRNAFIFLTIIALFGLLGYSARYVLPNYYKTNALFLSHDLTTELCSSMIGNLNGLLENRRNVPVVAAQLKISAETAAAIKSLSLEPVGNLVMTAPDTASGLPRAEYVFRINLLVQNTGSIPQIQAGLINFLENNEYSLRRKAAKRKRLELLEASLAAQNRSLDSLKHIVAGSILTRSSGQGLIYGEPVSPVEIYKLQSSYYRQQLDVAERLSRTNNMEVVQPFMVANAANYYDFGRLFFYCLLAGLVVALVLTPLIGKKV